MVPADVFGTYSVVDYYSKRSHTNIFTGLAIKIRKSGSLNFWEFTKCQTKNNPTASRWQLSCRRTNKLVRWQLSRIKPRLNRILSKQISSIQISTKWNVGKQLSNQVNQFDYNSELGDKYTQQIIILYGIVTIIATACNELLRFTVEP